MCWVKEEADRGRSRSAEGLRDQNTASVGEAELVQKGVHYRDAETWEKGSGGRRHGRAQDLSQRRRRVRQERKRMKKRQ